MWVYYMAVYRNKPLKENKPQYERPVINYCINSYRKTGYEK